MLLLSNDMFIDTVEISGIPQIEESETGDAEPLQIYAVELTCSTPVVS